ncbi:cupin domain-containing protein [Nocardioides daejeonensis]|uniref:cupin domain-containing protein n=1 Tax=Nocardioides daejeonensis TaxID=1046556 RepID=UPI0013A5A571|nr:cupin domain-containing protein [Nocardioides daejeonensis]
MRSRVNEVVSSIGPKLKSLRKVHGYSLQALAERSDVSAAAIHKIESSSMVPTISTLLKIAAALDKPVAYFVEEEEELASTVKITADDRPEIYTSHSGITLGGITGPYGKFLLAGALATVIPGASSGEKPMYHAGEELLYVVSGGLEFEVSGEVFTISAGESLHFRTQQPHSWRNPHKEDAVAVWMALRPQSDSTY